MYVIAVISNQFFWATCSSSFEDIIDLIKAFARLMFDNYREHENICVLIALQFYKQLYKVQTFPAWETVSEFMHCCSSQPFPICSLSLNNW